MRPDTWVTLEEVASGEWGNAGKAPHTGDVVAYRQGNKQVLLIGSFWCPLATPFMWRHSTTEGKATERRRLASCQALAEVRLRNIAACTQIHGPRRNRPRTRR